MSEPNSKLDKLIQAQNFSMQLLQLSTHKQSPGNKLKPIRDLGMVSRILKAKNGRYQSTRVDQEKTRDWMADEGVDIGKMRQLKDQIKASRLSEPKKEIAGWYASQFLSFKGLNFEQFQFKCEERLALKGIDQSFRKMTEGSKMKSIRRNIFEINFGIQDPNQNLNRTPEDARQQVEKLESLFSQALSEGHKFEENRMLNSLHSKMAYLLKREKDCGWLSLIASHIDMIQALGESVSDNERRNYLAILSNDHLQKYYAQYMSQEGRTSHIISKFYKSAEVNNWTQAFIQLRKGNLEGFQQALEGRQLDIIEAIATMQMQIQNFQTVDISAYGMDINRDNNPFEKMIKLIIMGSCKDQPSFKDSPIQLLDEPWFILRTLGIARSTNNQAQSMNSFRKRVDKYYSQSLRRLSSSETSNYDQFALGLLALASYQNLCNFYQTLSANQQLSPKLRLMFVHQFMLLLAYPQLLFPADISFMMRTVVEFVKELKFDKNDRFEHYFKTIKLLLERTPTELLLDNYKLVSRQLFPEIGDLYTYNQYFEESSKIDYELRVCIMRGVRLNSYQDYYELAQLFSQYGEYQLQRQLLLKLALGIQLQQQQLNEEQIFNGLAAGFEQRQEILEYAMEELKNISLRNKRNTLLDKQQDKVYTFLLDFRDLSALLRFHKTKQLKSRLSHFQSLRNNSQTVLVWLQQHSTADNNYLEIIVSLYEKLQKMYQTVFLADNKISRLKETYRFLSRQMHDIGEKYQLVRLQRYGKLIEALQC